MAHKRAKRSVREANRTKSGTDRAPNQHEEDRDLAKMPKNAMRVLLSAQTREDYRKRKREEAEGGASVGNKKGKGKSTPATATTTTASTSSSATNKPSQTSSASASSSTALKIQPNESLLHFNRRVEDSLRSSVAIAAKSARTHSTEIERAEREERKLKHDERVRKQTEKAKGKGKAKQESEDEDDEEEDEEGEGAGGAKKKAKSTPSSQPTTTSGASSAPPVDKHAARGLTDFAKAQSSSAPRRLNDIAMAPPTLTLPRFASRAIKANAAAAGSEGATEGMASKLGLSLAQARILEEERERVILRYRELKERRGIKAEMGME